MRVRKERFTNVTQRTHRPQMYIAYPLTQISPSSARKHHIFYPVHRVQIVGIQLSTSTSPLSRLHLPLQHRTTAWASGATHASSSVSQRLKCDGHRPSFVGQTLITFLDATLCYLSRTCGTECRYLHRFRVSRR
jgi:hypothetical protein